MKLKSFFGPAPRQRFSSRRCIWSSLLSLIIANMRVLLFAPPLEDLYGRRTRDAVRRYEVGLGGEGGEEDGWREGGPLGLEERRRGPISEG